MDIENQNRGHFDKNSPVSLYALMEERWSKKFMAKLAEVPELYEVVTDEIELKKRMKELYRYEPTIVDERYRTQLWLEYENALKLGRKMIMSNVYNLVGPESTFSNQVLRIAPRVAWMVSKPVSYDSLSKGILNIGLQRMLTYLQEDAFADGKRDHKLAKLQLEITKMMDLRQHGAPTQKIQEISLKGTIGANGEIQAAVEAADLRMLQQRKYELEERKRKAEGRAEGASLEPIDVEVVGNEERGVAGGEGGSGGKRGDEGASS